MRRGPRMPMEELASYLWEVPTPQAVKDGLTSPSPLYLGERGWGEGSEKTHVPTPHPPPLSPEYRGEGSQSIVWSHIFANTNPIEIEVGFGKGLFLVNAGQNRPQTNFFGIEIERKYTLFTATRLAKRGLRNVKVTSCDARWFLETLVAAGSVAAVHVYFPDPWWKNRHRKRRLFTEPFALQCARVLAGGGQLHLVSDVQGYFEESANMLVQIKAFSAMTVPDVKDPQHEMDFLTNFERKYRREGRPIYRGLWLKQ